MLPTVIQDPSFLWSISVALASDVGDRPAATTTSVPVGCCNRGSAHSSTTARTATRTAAIQIIREPGLRRGAVDGSSAPMRPIFGLTSCAARSRMFNALAALLVGSPESGPPGSPNISPPDPAAAPQRLRDLQRHTAVTRGHAVDVGRAHIGHLSVLDLDHVLGVALAAVREIEATDVDVPVRDQDLGVHEIVHGVLRIRNGSLAPESGGADRRVEGRDLPCGARLRSPLALDLVHLRRIVHTADVDLGRLDSLRQRAQT